MSKNFHQCVNQVLSDLRSAHPTLVDAGVNGHCDAFAWALSETFDRLNIPNQCLVIRRDRYAIATDQLMEYCPISHVVVEAAGTSWDVWGDRARDRWEDEWIQPREGDDVEPCYDVFSDTPMPRVELDSLRLNKDKRFVSRNHIERYKDHLKVLLDLPMDVLPKNPSFASADPGVSRVPKFAQR